MILYSDCVVERPNSLIMMNRYVTLQALGDGTYGSVVLGQRVDTGEKVSGCGWN